MKRGTKAESTAHLLEPEAFAALSVVMRKVAHDLNNLVTPVMAYPPLILSLLPDGSPAEQLLDAIECSARDLSHITDQLALFATEEKRPVMKQRRQSWSVVSQQRCMQRNSCTEKKGPLQEVFYTIGIGITIYDTS